MLANLIMEPIIRLVFVELSIVLSHFTQEVEIDEDYEFVEGYGCYL